MNVSPETIRRLDEFIKVDFKNVRDEYFTGLGEGILKVEVSVADGLLQTFNDTLLTDALGCTANAEASLAGALTSADSARALPMGFSAQIAESQARKGS